MKEFITNENHKETKELSKLNEINEFRLNNKEISITPNLEIIKSNSLESLTMSNNEKNIDINKLEIQKKFDENGKIYKENDRLIPNNEYTVSNGIMYKTDENGNIKSFYGEIIQYTLDAERDNEAQINVGGDDRKIGDDGGHLIARMFGGASGNENLVPMRDTINRGDYKKIENKIKEVVSKGNKVIIEGELKSEENSSRPNEIKIKILYNGIKSEAIFDNEIESIKLKSELKNILSLEDYSSFEEEINDMIEDGNKVSITSVTKEFDNEGKIKNVMVGFKNETIGEKDYRIFKL